MRPLEVVALALVGLALILFFVPGARRPAWARWLPAAAAVALGVQWLAEGHRWQLELVYPVCAGLLLASWLGERTRWHHALTVVLAGVGLLAWTAAVLLAAGSPMFELPEPTGPHAVGVTELHVADPARPETFTADPSDHREVMVRVWYPATPSDSQEPVPYWEDARQNGPETARLVREVLGIGSFDRGFDHYGDVPTHSFADAPPAESPERFPVLVFSHGYAVARPQSNTALMEELASRGYWVASIGHTYETPAVVFPDGRVAVWNEEAVGALLGDDEAEDYFADYDQIEDPAERDERIRTYLAREGQATESLKIWIADTRTVVDEIGRIASGERDTPFAGRLDPYRLGVLGMSFGGATAGAFCVEDPRCKAGLNLDGFQYGEGMGDAVVTVPFMILEARRGPMPVNEYFQRHAAGPFHIALIEGTTHMNFTDTSISSRTLRWVGALGEIEAHRMLEILNVWVPAFFDHYLLGRRSPLLAGESADFPEVELLSRNAGG